ncbi:hypothetical protein INR49_010362 [Caranx melampygus]|nr:hypothetical protein INR49_010362 [Caranx melampygus]
MKHMENHRQVPTTQHNTDLQRQEMPAGALPATSCGPFPVLRSAQTETLRFNLLVWRVKEEEESAEGSGIFIRIFES